MSKAFTKESENDDQLDLDQDSGPALPLGKNYMTPAGHKRMQQELYELKFKERPEVTKTVSWAAGNGDRSENGDYLYGKKKLREIDRRIRYLSKRLDAAEVIDPLKQDPEQVLFGATVTLLNEQDQQKTYAIVGVDEIDLNKGYISWVSPLGSALLRSREGDLVSFKSPKGIQHLEILKISYKTLA